MAVELGLKGMATMIDKDSDKISFSNTFNAKTLAAAKDGMHIDDDFMTVGVNAHRQWFLRFY